MKLFCRRKKKSSPSRGPKPRLHANSPFAIKEAYTSIRTKLIFTGKGDKCPVFSITSSLPSDGKTTNSVSLAVSFAMADQRVLLIDADMRKPSIHRYFNTECRNGLSELLAGLTTEIKLRDSGIPNLSLLTAGQIPPNPAELLGSKQMDALLAHVREHFDYVIIDTPPVNIVADACVLSEKITGFVLIVQSGKNHLYELKDAMQRLQEMNGNIVGMVLNDPDNKADSHYSYHHSRYYRYDRYKYYGESSSTTNSNK